MAASWISEVYGLLLLRNVLEEGGYVMGDVDPPLVNVIRGSFFAKKTFVDPFRISALFRY